MCRSSKYEANNTYCKLTTSFYIWWDISGVFFSSNLINSRAFFLKQFRERKYQFITLSVNKKEYIDFNMP